MRIPFDSLTMASVVDEIQPFVGSKVQKVNGPDGFTVVIELYGGLGRGELLLSCDPVFGRMYFVTRKPGNLQPLPGLSAAMRAHLEGAILLSAQQKGFDRVVEMVFEGPHGRRSVVAELMGKHSNLILLAADRRVIAAAKVVGANKSIRPIVPGHKYEPPPFAPKPPIWKAGDGEDLKDFEGASPFLVKLVAAEAAGREAPRSQILAELGDAVIHGRYKPVLVADSGAYPISVAALGLLGHERNSISVALEQHYALAIPRYEADQLRATLTTQLKRVLLAREAALSDLRQAADLAANAGDLQTRGELILAFGPALPEGSSVLETMDYEGNPIAIPLDPEVGFLENAQRLFKKAKKAKSGSVGVADQIERLTADKLGIESLLARLVEDESLRAAEEVREEARAHRWLHEQPVFKAGEKERPYEGHRIRELQGPRGYRVLYGENATSNDYLTTRVAKPNDWWLHVRGGVSAHVVVVTGKHPEKVGPDVIAFAAKIAVQNSVSKHAAYVPVDYTLRKHVRKPRGSAAGLAVYTQEKTIHVENR